MATKTSLSRASARLAVMGFLEELGEVFESTGNAPDVAPELAPVTPLRDRPFERLLPRTLNDLYAMLARGRRSLRGSRLAQAS